MKKVTASAQAFRSRRQGIRRDIVEARVRSVVSWYFEFIFGVHEGPGVLPFYCDPRKVGRFALTRRELSAAGESSLLRLFVTLTMFQGLRDVVVMRRQRALPAAVVESVSGLEQLREAIAQHECEALHSAEAFDSDCSVAKIGSNADCVQRPGLSCHVKQATVAFNRMGDMGKLPTSAVLNLWSGGGVQQILEAVARSESSPTKRATHLVERFAAVHRVGRKLATMFVSALATPCLSGGLAPWFPQVDGNELVVIDTNVARVVDALRPPGSPITYDARELWVREQAARVDLSRFNAAAPAYSPRLLQQAFYSYGSKANRSAREDPCASGAPKCRHCVLSICPFAEAHD